MKGLFECKASESNIRHIRVKDIVKEVEDYLKTYSLAGMDISWVDTMPVTTDPINTTNTTNVSQSVVDENLPQLLDSRGGSHVTNDDECISLDDEGSTKIRAFMAIAEDEPLVGKADARSGQWVDITMKKVHGLLSMTDGDERKHVLDYTHVDLHYVEDQRKNLVSKFNLLKQEIFLHKSELSNIKNTVSINCSLQNEVIRVNLENESLKDDIIDLKTVIKKWTCRKGRRKEKISSKEVIFTKADEFSSMFAPEITSDSKSECDSQEPLPPLPKLIGAAPSGTSESLISLTNLTLNMTDFTFDTPNPKKNRPSVKMSTTYVIKKKTEKSSTNPKPCSDKKANSSTEKLLLTPMEEVKGLKRQIKSPLGTPSSSFQPTYGSVTSETPPKKAPMILKPFIECKYCGFNDHHSNQYEFYHGCEVCGRIAHEASDCPKKHPNSRRPRDYLKRSVWYLYSGCSRHITRIKQYLHRYSKESGPKVVFGDDSSGDTEGYGLVNCNGIIFTRVAYGTIYNQNDEVVLIAPRRRDVYVIDMSSFNKESNAYFFAKASLSVNWLWHKRLSHLNFKNINNLAKHNLVFGLPSLNFSKDKNCSACEKGKHHKASFKTKRSFSINKSLHLLHTNVFGPIKPQTISHNKYTLVIVNEYSRKMENLNEVRVKELRSDNGTEFRNHKLEEFYDEKGPFRKFDEKADDGFFLGYSPVAKAFKVFNVRRQEMEETIHVTFSKDDEAISQSSTEEYFPYIHAYENTTPSESPILQEFVIPEDPLEFTEADNHPTLNESDQTELANLFEPTEP
ncbi:retrovirus-related pol polyprotein from transposon TNT 1-94 [Tanacetum coccineum]